MPKRYNFRLSGEVRGVDNTEFLDFTVNWRDAKYVDIVAIEGILAKAVMGTVSLGVAMAEQKGQTQGLEQLKKLLAS